jgi:hypothetical protein
VKAPAADRRVLLGLAGIVWSSVGLGLMAVAAGWLARSDQMALPAWGLGLVLGAIIHRWRLVHLAQRNCDRIMTMAPDRARICVFAFQSTRGYLIIAFMIVLGYTLRHTPLPRIYLAPVYVAMGSALLLASLRYFRALGR